MPSHYVSSFFKLSFQSLVSNTGRCEALVIPLCSDLQQNMTLFPNILNHRTQEEAALEVHQFFPLVKVGCSPYLAQFLCSVYAPPCEEPRQPCRELCNQAREGCEALMQRFGFTWPGILACNKFPTRHNGTNCIGWFTEVQSTAISTKTCRQWICELYHASSVFLNKLFFFQHWLVPKAHFILSLT